LDLGFHTDKILLLLEIDAHERIYGENLELEIAGLEPKMPEPFDLAMLLSFLML
jgi:hypothetical protein